MVLGDVDLANLLIALLVLPILASAEVVSSGATPPLPEACDVDGTVITVVVSIELASLIELGEDCKAFPPGAAKENCPLLFPPDLDIAICFCSLGLSELVTLERLRLITCAWILISLTGSTS